VHHFYGVGPVLAPNRHAAAVATCPAIVDALEPWLPGLGLISQKTKLAKRSARLCHDEKGWLSSSVTATLSY
jgi:hypothetical protein